MKVLREIFGRIWALWGLLIFTGTMVIAIFFYIPCFLLKEPAAAKWHRAVSRVWMTIYLHLIGCPLTVKGADNFSKTQNYVVISNHNSLMDVPISTPFMPHANKTIAKKEFASVPIFGWIYAAGSVLVDRKSTESRGKSYDKMRRVLDIGLDMVIYPEGTRNRTELPLKSFYDGAFRLAADTGKPIMPALIFYTREVLPAHKPFFMLPHRLEMHFLPPVETVNKKAADLKQQLYEIMSAYYIANNKP